MKKQLFLILSAILMVQSAPITLTGTVVRDVTIDPFALGHPVEGVTVSVRTSDTVFTTTTDQQGTFSLPVELPVSIAETHPTRSMPEIGIVQQKLSVPAGLYSRITISDLRGRTLFSGAIPHTAITVDLPQLAEGVRIVTLKGVGGDRSFKWMNGHAVSPKQSGISSIRDARFARSETVSCTLQVVAQGYAPILISFTNGSALPKKIYLTDMTRGQATDIGVKSAYRKYLDYVIGGDAFSYYCNVEPYRVANEKMVWPLIPNSQDDYSGPLMYKPNTLGYILQAELCFSTIARTMYTTALPFADLDTVENKTDAIYGTVVDIHTFSGDYWDHLESITPIKRSDFYIDTREGIVYATKTKIQLADSLGIKIAETTTDSLGRFRFDGVPEGKYVVIRPEVILLDESYSEDNFFGIKSDADSVSVNTTTSRKSDFIGGGFKSYSNMI